MDPLTKVYNRHKLPSIVNGRAFDFEGVDDVSVLMADIDFFKHINDTYGHDKGDEVLKSVANVIKGCTRSNDYIIRWGGEEFLVVITGNNSYETLKALIELIRVDTTKLCVPSDDGDVNITISCGVAIYKPGERPAQTINRADSYLYKAKKNGKNQVIANETF